MTQFIYQGAGNSEAQQRLALSFLFAQDSPGIATDGVLSGLLVTQTATASAAVLVSKGAGVVQDSLLNGARMVVLDSDLTLDVLTANPVGGLPRNDMVVFDGATVTSGSGGVRVIVGTPNASPTDPTVPATAIPLARLRHAASATTVPTAKIDVLRVLTAPAGGRVLVTGTAQRDSIVKYVGLEVWRTDVNRRETWDGTGWLTEVQGMDTVVATNANGDFSLTTGLSTILFATLYNGNGGTGRVGNRQNITLARNTSGASYTGGTVTGTAFAAETKQAVSSSSLRLDWFARGYA